MPKKFLLTKKVLENIYKGGIKETHLDKRLLYSNKKGNSGLLKKLLGYINRKDVSVLAYDLVSGNDSQSDTFEKVNSDIYSTLRNIC